jgi:hypothetical protein
VSDARGAARPAWHRRPPTWALYPAGCFAWALARGLATGRDPYPLIDLGAIGAARVGINAVVILAAFLVLAQLSIAADRRQARRG